MNFTLASRTVRRSVMLIAFVVGAPLLTACNFGGSTDANSASNGVDQSKMCIADTDRDALSCPEGQLIFARVATSDESTRPLRVLNTVAVYCNTNDQIVQNAAGVICTLTKARVDQFTSGGNAPSRQNLSQGTGSSNAQ